MTTVEQETLPVTLKPCPFCGAHDDFNPSVSQSHKYAEPGDAATGKVANPAAGLVLAGWYVECDECGGLGGQSDDRAAAITVWNTRADHEPRAVEGGLREAFERFVNTVDCVGRRSNAIHDAIIEARSALAAQSPAPTEGEGWRLGPVGDPVSLNECPPGPFEFNGSLGFKTEYGAAKWLPERDAFTVSHWPDPYCLDSGEAFWGGALGQESRAALIVQPLAVRPSTQPQADAGSADHSSTREG